MSTTVIFTNDEARARISGWYDVFRKTIPFEHSSREVKTSFGSTHVLVAGPVDAPPLLVLHGAFTSSAHVMRDLDLLIDRYRVYAIDVIGQSVKSADVRLAVNDDSYGKWLLEVADGLALDKFAIYGASWGGFVALRTAESAPERVSHLVLLVPAGVVAGPMWAGFVEVGLPTLFYRMFPSPKRLGRVMAGLFTSWDDNWKDYIGDAIRDYRLNMQIPPLFKELKYKGPTLVLAADRDLQFPGEALAARMRELTPKCEVEVFENCRHCPPLSREFMDRLAIRVGEFLDKA